MIHDEIFWYIGINVNPLLMHCRICAIHFFSKWMKQECQAGLCNAGFAKGARDQCRCISCLTLALLLTSLGYF